MLRVPAIGSRHRRIGGWRCFDLCAQRRRAIGEWRRVAVSGPGSCELAAEYADVMIATELKPELIEAFNAAGGTGRPSGGWHGRLAGRMAE